MSETKIEGFNLQAGMIVQTAYNEVLTSTVYSSPTPIPADDTIPQITEGVEILTCNITPKFSNSKILIVANVFLGENTNASNAVIATLFRDSVANALSVTFNANEIVSSPFGSNFSFSPLTLRYYDSPATTSTITYRLRGGCDSTSNLRLNGANGQRWFGGSLVTSITLQEIKQ